MHEKHNSYSNPSSNSGKYYKKWIEHVGSWWWCHGHHVCFRLRRSEFDASRLLNIFSVFVLCSEKRQKLMVEHVLGAGSGVDGGTDLGLQLSLFFTNRKLDFMPFSQTNLIRDL
jgi:hypothetical protein